MSELQRDPRAAVMILVDASWEDPSGAAQTAPARMENKSAGGTCIRLDLPITAGSRLRIRSRHEQFSGVVKYCRSEGNEYLIGVQRDTVKIPVPYPPVSDVEQGQSAKGGDPMASKATIQTQTTREESKPSGITRVISSTAMAPRGVDPEMDSKDRLCNSRPQRLDDNRWTELQSKRPPKEKEAGNERKPMQPSWLERAPWHKKRDIPSTNATVEKVIRPPEPDPARPEAAPARKETPADNARAGIVSLQVELLPMEDVYRTAGIISPRRGYGINKVVEMLHSEHIRGLSKEMKRAAVMMALDAASVTIDQVLQDAKARQEALDSYEIEQRKLVEAEWKRKTQENLQMEAELERLKTHCMTRINRHLDSIARGKTMFSSWLTIKQQESQGMSEAAELCLQSSVSELPSASPPEVATLAASAKTV